MKIRSIIFSAIAAVAMSSALADNRLIGDWSSADANNGALKGNIAIKKGGAAVLKPEAQPELVGTWAVPDPGALTLTMGDHGTAKVKFRFDKQNLVLTYDNGNEQVFTKQGPPPKKAVVARKKAQYSESDAAPEVKGAIQ